MSSLGAKSLFSKFGVASTLGIRFKFDVLKTIFLFFPSQGNTIIGKKKKRERERALKKSATGIKVMVAI